MANKKTSLEDDGLITPEVGAWSENKYRLIAYYARMFATGMKTKWQCRVYIDLFAGSGRSRIENTDHIVPGSPILALEIPDKFDRYIFCELDSDKMDALQKRVAKAYPGIDVRYVAGDANASASSILSEIPAHSRNYKVLSFCVVDPCKIGNLAFDTIRTLSAKFMDFFVLIPSYMDANRNKDVYLFPPNKTLDTYLGTPDWRDQWPSCQGSFASFVADFFGQQMKQLRYLYPGLHSARVVQRAENKLPLYHTAFYSRNPLGVKFWNEARKYSDDQIELFEPSDYE